MELLINQQIRLWTVMFFLQGVILLLSLADGARIKCPDVSPCRCRIRNKRREKEQKAVDIDCRNKNLKAIPDFSTLKGIPINVLQITYNKITSIEDDAFNGLYLKSVQSHDAPPWLRLDGNPIVNVSRNAFRGVMADTLLFSMEYTSLDTLPVEALQLLENITQLHLGDNNITEIPSHAFAGLAKLELLSLNNNPIRRLSPEAFVDAKFLHDLSIKKIGLQTFPTDALKRATALKTVHLNDNAIETLPDYAFSGFQTQWDAVFISLANNGLASVSPRAFNRRDTMMSLTTVHLENNHVTDVSFLYKPCFPLFRALGFRLHIENNPVLCDCNFYNLASEGLYAVKGECGAPAEFEGVPFDTMWQSEGMAIFRSKYGPLAMKHCGPANSTRCEQDELPRRLAKPNKAKEQEKIIIQVVEDGHKTSGEDSASYEATANSSSSAGNLSSEAWQLVATATVAIYAVLYSSLH